MIFVTLFEFLLFIAPRICDEYCGLFMMTRYNHQTKRQGDVHVSLYINLKSSEQGSFHAAHYEYYRNGGAYRYSRPIF